MGDGQAVERQTITAFFTNPKRRRLLIKLDDPNAGRGWLTAELPHTHSLDERWRRDIPRKDQRAATIERILRDEGAPDHCYVISEDSETDEQTLPLGEALDRVVGSGRAALLICVPGVLAFYQGEDLGNRCLLKRTR